MRKSRLPRRHRFTTRFVRAERGAVAAEFALVLLPFLMMVFAMIELGMALLAYTSMETAMQVAARRIRTGEFQTSAGNTKSDFKNMVCANMSWVASCSTNLYVDVRTYSNFAAMGASSPMPGTSFNAANTCFTAGNPTDIVLVRTYFKWRLFTPFLDVALENMGSGSGMRLMSAATAFRNEPYNESAALGGRC